MRLQRENMLRLSHGQLFHYKAKPGPCTYTAREHNFLGLDCRALAAQGLHKIDMLKEKISVMRNSYDYG